MKKPVHLDTQSFKNKLRRVKNNLSDNVSLKKHQIVSLEQRLSKSSLKPSDKIEHVMNPQELQERYEEIVDKNNALVNLHSFDNNAPLVSIIILNRNGHDHLQRLFKNFKEKIQYPSYEIIVVDNASTDNSLNFLEAISTSLPIRIIKNNVNESFSKSNNEAAKAAKGEFLLLLNNDVEPLYGWLNNMMQTALKSEHIGAVGAKLIYPDCSESTYNKNNSFKIQHSGIAFKKEDVFIKPYNISHDDPFDKKIDFEMERAALTAAALLVNKDYYWQVGGLDEGYNYGYEDVDFCLKLLKKGYKNIYCAKAVLFHYEFGTQETNKNKEVKNRRLQNRALFYQKWNRWLSKQLFLDKLNNNLFFSENPLSIAFAVTESGKNVSAGDYFTALELGESLKKLGWNIIFLPRQGPGNWYELEENVDVIISMLDSYDPRKIRTTHKSLIKIAWARNWFERWVSNPGFSDYDIVCASSKTAVDYINHKSGEEALLLPIATNNHRFNDHIPKNQEYASDYCFTGSYWNDPREIIEFLDPQNLPYHFKLYGKNWDQVEKFKDYDQGFIDYNLLPEVYASTKIVIDDANRVTKSFGAVNSRVYDALASGALVVTNGKIGAEETFKGNLPVFRSKEELNTLIKYYLVHEDKRIAKIKELQRFVLKNHTYENRAYTLKRIIEKHFLKTRVAIKIPVPQWKNVNEWGDYHLARGLQKEFEKRDCHVIIQILPEWDTDQDAECDVVIVLRGLSKYYPKKQHFNIMWNISHPDKIEIEEYEQYDYVLIASEIWAEVINGKVKVPVKSMLQCTDPELFYPDFSEKYQHQLLFVGNSRKVMRTVINDLMPTEKDLGIYGMNWRRFVLRRIIKMKHLKGKHIPNNELRKAYSSCKILLNDHWEDMRDKGFISNRLFDGFASGAFIISDKVQGAEKIFGDALVTYDIPSTLNHAIDYYLEHGEERKEKIEKAQEIVLNKHTFAKRVAYIMEIIRKEEK